MVERMLKRRDWHLFLPKTVTVLARGYNGADFRADTLAGLTVAIVALPLSMALAIASGTTPYVGLVTAVIAGFLISALGGSRFQIGGPTGAFVVVVYGVMAQHGMDGLIVATLMAGAILVLAGLLRLGTWIKYIPDPVVTGFTSGIAVIIFASQVKDILGLSTPRLPAEFLPKWAMMLAHLDTVSPAVLGLSLTCLGVILALRAYAPRVPAFLVAVVLGAVLTALLKLPVPTIGSTFGALPGSLPAPHLPQIDLAMVKTLLPSAFTIAFLAGVESLLSAVVADGMTGRRHRSNCELVAQGVANAASAMFGGLPATGAIARTATNIRSGARSPVAGMLHAVFLLAFMLAFMPLVAYVPLASLAAILVVVAWNMSEVHRFISLLKGAWGERLLLVTTFVLTIAVDLTVAIEVGVIGAAILFMHRMAQAVSVETGVSLVAEDRDDFSEPGADIRYEARPHLPEGVELFHFRGPLFFASAGTLRDLAELLDSRIHHLVLDLADTPFIDPSGLAALDDLHQRLHGRGIALTITGAQGNARKALRRHYRFHPPTGLRFAGGVAEALSQ